MRLSLLFCTLVCLVPAKADLITNGSFESGLTGWTVFSIPINRNIGLDNQGGPGFDGLFWFFLGGFDALGYVEQTVTGLTSNTTYAVDFLMASETAISSDSLIVSMTNGSLTPSQQFSAPPSSFTGWRTWVSREYDFVASGPSATVRFSSVPLGQHFDVGFDNVSINAVPEPASIMLLWPCLLGVSGLAIARLRKQSKTGVGLQSTQGRPPVGRDI
jgi:hypothetical protein